VVDIITPLLAAGFSLAEKVIFSWFEGGKSEVRISRLEASINELSGREAERLRLRQDDLRQITDQIIRELVAAAPQLSYVKPRFQEPVVKLDFDPKNPDSSKELLQDLRGRLTSIRQKEMASAHALGQRADVAVPAEGQSRIYEVLPPATHDGAKSEPERQRQGNRSSELLQDLLRRIAERENPRP
jgi:hypothetical protein